MAGWQPIASAKQDGEHVLIAYRWANERRLRVIEAWFNDGYWCGHMMPMLRAVKWMPLPDPNAKSEF